MKKSSWSISQSDDLYNVSGWGDPYFSVNKKGDLAVHPKGNPKKSVSVKVLVDQIVERGIQTPFLLRFNDILTHRLTTIQTVFENAISEYSYKGNYHNVYPIKVNQQRHVVDQIAAYCKKGSFGLEAGSKPELLAVLALTENDETPIVCNGYKDKEFFEIALVGTKMGKPVYPVIEKYSEFKTIAEVSKSLDVKPLMGVRVKLSSAGSGKWQSSGGYRSKFGLSVTELLRGIEYLKENDLLGGLRLLHFHIGSQITDISAIKKALKEIGRFYVELKKAGVPLEIIDVGGGLGVDYDGSKSNKDSSMNYSLQEYANDVVFQIREICDEAGVDHPNIFTECGRASAAHHAVLIMNVLGISGYDRAKIPSDLDVDELHKPLKELLQIRQGIKRENSVELFHDTVSSFQECLNLFNLGYMNVKDRGLAEELYFSILKRCQVLWQDEDEDGIVPEEFRHLEEMLSDTYFCNFSVFQSLPDLWAIDHLFPIMPIHRLKEEPTEIGTIADITCDSDGKIDRFIDPQPKQKKRVLNLHAHNNDKDYYLGVFLVGAYQETLGDLHNLFGDTNVVHISLDRYGDPVIDTVVKGDTVKEVLSYVQYDVNDLIYKMHKQLEGAVKKRRIDFKESGQFLKFYEAALEGYTYLEETEALEEY
jgi:arginine decarboxylase